MNYSLGKMRQIWAICTKSGQQCSRSGPTSQQKKFIHVTGVPVVWMVVMSLVSQTKCPEPLMWEDLHKMTLGGEVIETCRG